MKIQPIQQIADHIVRSQSNPFEALPPIARDIRAVKWRMWHGHVDRAIRDLERTGKAEGFTEVAALGYDGAEMLEFARDTEERHTQE